MDPKAGRAPVHSQECTVASLTEQIPNCRICVEHPIRVPLPHEPRPVAVLSDTAKLCLCGQAPGTRVHASGRPFTDPSGDRLRDWLGVDEATFYDASQISIIPMGFCFPGLDAKGGDKPPRPECRRTWHPHVFKAMRQIDTIVAIGKYAQDFHLGPLSKGSLRENVIAWREIWEETSERHARGEGARILPVPHPSWRNNSWLKKNPWFDEQVLPMLRKHVREILP